MMGGDDLTDKRSTFYRTHLRTHLHVLAKYCPLVAAVFAPLSTLLDIPALSEHWYSRYDTPQADPKASLALSAIGLALNVSANILLIIRFSSRARTRWRNATRLSLLFWIGKTAVAVANLIVFGILTRNSPGYSYSEGFWCAVVSVIDAGVISIALLFHYFLAFGNPGEDTSEVRMEGRRFMLSVTLFTAILALQALVFCEIEGWSYTDAIYAAVQTALTIGYGDFVPTTTAGKVLVFVFSVLTISQLGNEIAMIIKFISVRANERRERWRKRYEGAMHREANAIRPKATLLEEMALIHQINSREEMMSKLYDLMWSAVSLVLFWIIGATMFSQIEGWTYGNAIYAVMIMSLTIGFGDFTPETPAGRVVFIVYALMAVPIVTSFAVQTITGLLSTYSERGAAKNQFLLDRHNTPDAFKPHSDFVQKAHDSYHEIRQKLLGSPKSTAGARALPNLDNEKEHEQTEVDEKTVQMASDVANRVETDNGELKGHGEVLDMEIDLLKRLMDLTIRLEAEARELLLNTMENGLARTLLMADRNIQVRDVRALRGDEANLLEIWRGVERQTAIQREKHPNDSEQRDRLGMVKRYRDTFAEVLVVGSILRKLEGDDKNQFERWRGGDQDQTLEIGKSARTDATAVEDLNQVADEQFKGITGLLFKRHTKQLRGKLFSGANQV